jgi:hypothetical protein
VGAHRVDVNEENGALANPDYASAFAVATAGGDARSAEQWIRDAFEDAPRAVRSFVVIGWRYLLGLQLGPPRSPAHVLGWKIVASSPDSIVLEVRSALVSARKVLRVESSRVVTTTFVRYEQRAGRAVWSALAPAHHRTEPYLLGRAAINQRGHD